MNEMSWKEDYIAQHGEEAYAKKLAQRKEWGDNLPGGEAQRSKERRDADPEKWRAYCRDWSRRNPETNKKKGRQVSRKTGKYYAKKQKYKQTGIPGERERIRMRHGYYWRKYKNFVAPNSQLHHQWVPNTADYTGLALVEKDAHRYGRIDVIQILEGKITLLTEKEIIEQETKT